ncbi:MAG: histidine ammonia-lyase [Saprospiraceae bacterium]|nr:histidine ammonia-lyase [Saprospiraceae bacterium]
MQKTFLIQEDVLTIRQLRSILETKQEIHLSAKAIQAIEHCRTYLQRKLENLDAMFYGINTGFGSLCNIRIGAEEIEQLQLNLVRSHASGCGDEVPPEIVRIMLLLKIQNLSFGYSGVRLETVERLLLYYNQDILPVIYQLGSLGASGDLAPLAHLSLPLIGEGEVRFRGKKMATADALKQLDLTPLSLQAKEGLALLNGTQFSTAYACWCAIQSEQVMYLADLCAAVSLDAFACKTGPFDDRLHQIRPHKGQIQTAASIRTWLQNSELAAREHPYVQDPYAFRCVPQVHGASRDALNYVHQVFETEVNAVTDNPNIFPDDDLILSGGNFHAQPIALSLDFMAIALSELGSISERRTYQLISGQRDLPAFLTPKPGLHSGLMIPQYTAASIASQNKQLCTPASVDSIVSCNGQEDHVSMAANAATKGYRVVQNVERLLAIEFMTAAQAMEFRRPAKSSPAIEKILSNYRKLVPKLEEDRILAPDMEKTIDYLRTLRAVEYDHIHV